MSLSSQTATATHKSGAGAWMPPRLWKEAGQTAGASYSPTKGSKQPERKGCGLAQRRFRSQLLLEGVLRIWESEGRRELLSEERDEA